jgi:tetratricopeptide (TPR) repeat protein
MAPPAMLSSRPPDPLPRATARLHESEPRQEAEPETEDAGEDDASYEDVGDGDFEQEQEQEEQPLELSRRSRHPSPDGEVMVESSIEVVEEVGEPLSTGTTEQAARILADAAAFRRAHFDAKAIETLRIGLEVAPRSIEVHEVLRDVLMDTGRPDDAVSVMLSLAGLQIDSLDGESAARTLQELLGLDPQNDRATEMLRELGYELVEEPATSSEGRVPPMRPEYHSTSSYDPEAPLPSYDLEEIGPEDVALRSYSEPSMRTAPAVGPMARGSMDDIDDPFGAEAPLPSFPLDPPPESEAAFELVGGRLDATDAYASQPDHEEIQDSPAAQRAPELESALEEAEFFATRGLYDDARTILEEQLARLPNHPLLVERLAELDTQERGTPGGSGTRPSPAAANVEDRSFDIAESLGALDGGDRVSNVGPPSFRRAHEQVDVEEVFAKFKEGVAKQIGVDDAQSHYDLGVAYKEMGLIDDAIREFDTAARDPKRTCICLHSIGMIQLERGNLNEAIDAFIRGLQSPDRTKEQESALCYEIGTAYEVKRMNKQALEHFQRSARLVPTFRDVQERIRRLTKTEPKPVRAVAVGADDEFDRAFDDILGGGKLP